MKSYSLDTRLMSAAGLVRQGAVFADIGTDHAHLPVFLLKEDRISRAVLTDINEGPLASARMNVEAEGLLDRVELVLTDGAAALADRGITDYAICGMGGELIARIIADAPHLMDCGVRLILIPMSRQSHLRHALAKMGYAIEEERYSASRGKHYVCIAASYTGVEKDVSFVDAELGMIPSEVGGRVEYVAYLSSKLAAAEKMLRGRRREGVSSDEEEALVLAIKKRISEMEELINDCK